MLKITTHDSSIFMSVIVVQDTEVDIVFAFFVIFSRLILSLTKEEDLTILACEQVFLLALTFKSTIYRHDRVCNKGVFAGKSAAFVSRVLPI